MGKLSPHVRIAAASVDVDLRNARRLYLWAFLLRFGAGIAGWLLTFVFHLPFMQDAFHYEQQGADIARDWLSGHSSAWLTIAMKTGRAPWLLQAGIACFYWLTGGLRIIPLLLLCFCLITSFTPVLSYKIARHIGLSRPAALLSGYLIALSPAFAFWSGALYKEGLILLFLNLSIYQVFRLQESFRWQSIALVAGCMAALLGLRFYISAIMTVVVFLGLILGRAGTRTGQSPLTVARQVPVVASFAAVLIFAGLSDSVRRILPADTTEALATIESSRIDLASTATSGYAQDLRLTTPGEVLAYLPIGMGYFLFSPLPWQIGRLRQNLAIPETAFWILLYPLILRGIFVGLRKNFQASLLLLATVVPVSVLYALFAGNIGTAYRMRTQVWLLLAIFAGWGWESWKENKLKSTVGRVSRRSAVRERRALRRHASTGPHTVTLR
jgi:hypothetical protein